MLAAGLARLAGLAAGLARLAVRLAGTLAVLTAGLTGRLATLATHLLARLAGALAVLAGRLAGLAALATGHGRGDVGASGAVRAVGGLGDLCKETSQHVLARSTAGGAAGLAGSATRGAAGSTTSFVGHFYIVSCEKINALLQP